MKVTDNRTITVEIDGTKHKLSLSDLQRLYDMIGGVVGISRHGTSPHRWPYYPSPGDPYIYGSVTVPNATLPKADPDVLVLNTEVKS